VRERAARCTKEWRNNGEEVALVQSNCYYQLGRSFMYILSRFTINFASSYDQSAEQAGLESGRHEKEGS